MNFIINNKIALKILSGLVAIVLWFAITYTEDPIISQSLGDISIEFEGEEDCVYAIEQSYINLSRIIDELK